MTASTAPDDPDRGRAPLARRRAELRADTADQLGSLSTVVHRIGDLTALAWVAWAVGALVAAFLVALVIAGFPEGWEVGFATVASAVTLVMVFVIQHTQNRQQLATQLKLDELIRTSPLADDLLVHVEYAEDEELVEREREQVDHHSTVRGRGGD